MNNRTSLSHRQLAAIPHLLAARTFEEGAKLASVGRSTVIRWLKDPAFQHELRLRRSQIVDASMETLQGNLQRAAGRLVELIEHENPRVALSACKALIDFTLRRQEIEDVTERLDAIEVSVDGTSNYR